MEETPNKRPCNCADSVKQRTVVVTYLLDLSVIAQYRIEIELLKRAHFFTTHYCEAIGSAFHSFRKLAIEF